MVELSTQVILDGIEQYGARINHTGSRYIVSPPPIDGEGGRKVDDDYLVEVPSSSVLELGTFLEELGFEQEGHERYPDPAHGKQNHFYSWRRNKLNLIVTTEPQWAQQHRLATIEAKRLNLKTKEERVALFQHYLYGKAPP